MYMKNSPKLLQTKLKNTLRKSIKYHDQVDCTFSLVAHIWRSLCIIYLTDKIEDRNHMIISRDAEKAFYKVHILEKLEIRTYFKIIKIHTIFVIYLVNYIYYISLLWGILKYI